MTGPDPFPFASPSVLAVARDGAHRFSKGVVPELRLIAGEGVEGDAHRGVTVKHRSRVAVDPTRPNLRQVHLLPAEFFAEAARAGFALGPGALGENVATVGLDLHALPVGTRLGLGGEAVVELTGLRNPCAQIEAFRPGLLALVLRHDPALGVVRRAGVMGVVASGGVVRPGDRITVATPAGPHRALERV